MSSASVFTYVYTTVMLYMLFIHFPLRSEKYMCPNTKKKKTNGLSFPCSWFGRGLHSWVWTNKYTPVNAHMFWRLFKVMKAIIRERESWKRVMILLWVSQTLRELILLQWIRHNLTKEALLCCKLVQCFLESILIRVIKVCYPNLKHVHPFWPSPSSTFQK